MRKPRRRAEPEAGGAPAAEQPPIGLGESLDLPAAAPLAAALLQRRGQDLSLDASAVRRLGGQCLQVLLAARATWQSDGHRLRIVSPSIEFTDAATLLGAGFLQTDPVAAPSTPPPTP